MSLMVNFRVKSQDALGAIDFAAKTAGMDRSTFIRMAVEKEVIAVSGGPRIVLAGSTVQRQVSDAPKIKPEDCLHPPERLNKTSFGIKICKDCGSKIA